LAACRNVSAAGAIAGALALKGRSGHVTLGVAYAVAFDHHLAARARCFDVARGVDLTGSFTFRLRSDVGAAVEGHGDFDADTGVQSGADAIAQATTGFGGGGSGALSEIFIDGVARGQEACFDF
jgi:hypothetical protein